MILIKLRDGLWIAADQVTSVYTVRLEVAVKLRDGSVVYVQHSPDTDLNREAENLVEKINHAITTMHGPAVEHKPKFKPHDQD